ncbi:MAG: hypothetical protein WAU78_10495 [Roseiarcus sp.]
MAGRPGKYQPRFTAGQLDALMQANTDLDAYSKGAAAMVNLRPLPQGGVTARGGLMKIDHLRGALNSLALTGGPALPISALAVGANTTVATYSLPSGQWLSAVDVVAFGGALSGGAAPTWSQPNPPESPLVAGTIQVFYLVGATWTQLDRTLGFVDTLRTRRFARPVGQSVAATQIKVVVNCTTTGGATFYAASIAAWDDWGGPVAAVVKPFSFESGVAYDMVFTPGNIEVYSTGAAAARLASIPTPIGAAQIPTFKWTQELATMFVTSQAFAPLEIQRQGSDVEWNIQNAVFPTIPLYDFGDVVYANAIPAVWTLTFVNFDTRLANTAPPVPTNGCQYTISVNGVPCTAQQQPSPGNWSTSNWTSTAAAIQAAVSAIPGVAAGVTVRMTETIQDFSEFDLTFAGLGNEGDGWAVSGAALDKADAAITAAKTVVGVDGGEPIMSSTRGWPGACCLTQERLLLGGFPQLPLSILLSEVGNPYQLDTRLTASASPFLITLDGQGNETILDIHIGRALEAFTTLGEYWFEPGALSATSPPTVVWSTSNGIAPSVDPIESEGLTTFVHASQGLLLEYSYQWQVQNFTAKSISTSSSSLVQGVVDNALQRATEGVDTNRHYLALASGEATLRATMNSEQINAFAALETDGEFQAVDCNAAAEVNWIVQRQVNGSPVQFLEKMVPGLWLDGAETFAVTAGQSTISGLTDFIGATVWAIVDGYPQGPFTVGAGASIALAFAALANGAATVGRWTAPVVTTLPVPRDVGPRTVVRRPARIHTVRLNLVDTTNIAIGANGGGPWDCPLFRFGGLADVPPSAQPYTGWTALEGLPGFQEDAQATITQTRPGALTVTGVVVEVDL